MKTLMLCVFLTLLAIGSHAAELKDIFAAQSRSASSQAVDMLEAMREQMPCGFPGLGIPPLAPLKTEHRDINIDSDGLNLVCTVDDFVMVGLDEFEIRALKIDIIRSRMNFDFLFKSVNFTTKYNMKMGNGDAMKRNGKAFFALEDIVITGLAKYSTGLLGGGLRVKEFKIYISIGSVNSNIEGLSKYKIVNRKLNEVIEEWFMLVVNDNTDNVAEWTNDNVVPVANDIIGDRSIKDLLGLIGGGGGGGGGGEGDGGSDGGGEGGEAVKCVPPQ